MSEYIKWRKYYSDAENYMDSVYNNSGTLIEVAAQHPLTDSGEPGDEFRARLDSAIKFYYNLEKPSKFYIPGSLHKFNDKVDKVSLSEAGNSILLKMAYQKMIYMLKMLIKSLNQMEYTILQMSVMQQPTCLRN